MIGPWGNAPGTALKCRKMKIDKRVGCSERYGCTGWCVEWLALYGFSGVSVGAPLFSLGYCLQFVHEIWGG